MGVFISRLLGTLFGDKEARILVLGLDNAGKTTILCILIKETVSTCKQLIWGLLDTDLELRVWAAGQFGGMLSSGMFGQIENGADQPHDIQDSLTYSVLSRQLSASCPVVA